MTKPMGNNVTLCPYCGRRCYSSNARQQAPTVREVRYTCGNVECGCIFIAQIAATHVLVPSALPGAQVNLPLSQVLIRAMEREADRRRAEDEAQRQPSLFATLPRAASA